MAKTAFLVAALGLVAACSSAGATPGEGANGGPGAPLEVEKAASSLARNDAPVVADAAARALGDGNRSFAFDMNRTLRASEPTENAFFSPYSISIALAMTYAGARGTTATEIASTLHFTLPQEELHPAFNAVDLAIGRTGTVKAANSIWGSPTLAFETSFLDTLATSYGAGVNLVDFGKPDAAAATINRWVSDRTNALIPSVLSADALRAARFVLVNALYFKDDWRLPFTKEATSDAPFHARTGDVTVPMMHAEQVVDYADGAGYKAVRLPYKSGVSFVAVLPDDLAAFETSLDATRWQAVLGAMASVNVDIALPKLKLDRHVSLVAALKRLGMTSAFSSDADLAGIATEELEILDVIHQAVVAVDEKGTEAAAATAVVGGVTSAMEPPKHSITLDRPFLFAIQDDTTGTILFLGHVEKPQ